MRRSLALAALALASFSVGASEYVLTGQLDLVSEGLGASEAAVGQLVTVFSLTYGILTPVLVAVLARRSRRTVLIAALGVFAATNLISYGMPDFWWIGAARIVMAASAGVTVVTALGMVRHILPADRHGRGIATVQTGFTAALVLGVPAGRVIAETLGWRSTFLVLAGIGALVALLMRLAVPDVAGSATIPLTAQLGLLRRTPVVMGLLVTLVWLGGYTILYTYLSPYLVDTLRLEGSAVTVVLFFFGLASMIGTQLGGRLADKAGYRRALIVTKLAHVAALVTLPLLSSVGGAAIAALLLWSLAAWGSAAGQQLRLADLDEDHADTLLGLNQSVMQLAIAAGSAVGGGILGALGVEALPWVAASTVAVSLILLLAVRATGGIRAAG